MICDCEHSTHEPSGQRPAVAHEFATAEWTEPSVSARPVSMLAICREHRSGERPQATQPSVASSSRRMFMPMILATSSRPKPRSSSAAGMVGQSA